MIIGVTGYTGAGKGEFINFLQEITGFQVHSLSTAIRDEIKKNNQEVTRKNLLATGNRLRAERGNGVLAIMTSKKIKDTAIVDSIKNPEEALELQKRFGDKFVLVTVKASMKNRFERTRNRAREKDPQTWEGFVKLEKMHSGVKGSHSQRISDCEAMVDYVIHNDNTLGELKSKAKALIDYLR